MKDTVEVETLKKTEPAKVAEVAKVEVPNYLLSDVELIVVRAMKLKLKFGIDIIDIHDMIDAQYCVWEDEECEGTETEDISKFIKKATLVVEQLKRLGFKIQRTRV